MTETKFAETAVRIWRLRQRLEVLRAELKRRDIPRTLYGCYGYGLGPYKPTDRNERAVKSFKRAADQLSRLVIALAAEVAP